MWNPFDVLLVNPKNPTTGGGNDTAFTSENLALAYLSAALQQHGANVLIIDCDLDQLSGEDISKLVQQHRPCFVGLTALARNADEAIDIACSIRRTCPEVPIVLGGLHFTYCGEQVMREIADITYVIRGEGEISISSLYCYLKHGSGCERDIGGLIYRDSTGSLKQAPMQPAIENLDKLPNPDRQVLRRALDNGLQPAIPMLGSRGCYARCLFCNASKVYVEGGGSSWRHRSPENIVDEMAMLIETYGVGADPVILFYDDSFIGPGSLGRKYANALANEMLARQQNVMFETFLRADSFHDDYVLIAKLRKAGMVRTFMGIEAPDDQELKLFRKGVTSKQIAGALDNLARNHVLTPSSGFIMFLPYSTFEMLKRNAEYLRSIGQASIWNLSTRLDVYAGNEFVKKLEEMGLITGSKLHGGLFTYRFQDERVGAFADFIDISEHKLAQRLDACSRFIEFNYHSISYEITQIAGGDKFNKPEEIQQTLTQIQESAYHFFMDSLEAFRDGSTDKDLIKLKTIFLKNISSLIDELEGSYGSFLLRINNILSSGIFNPDSQIPSNGKLKDDGCCHA